MRLFDEIDVDQDGVWLSSPFRALLPHVVLLPNKIHAAIAPKTLFRRYGRCGASLYVQYPRL
jgi:hypothetical protein